jgi:Flp pilus assembly protein TadB
MGAEDELKELEEQAEEGAAKSMRPVALTMSILAVIVAVITMLGERSHTSAIINQAKASDQWNLYQAKKNRAYNTGLNKDTLTILAAKNPDAEKLIDKYKEYVEKEKADSEGEQEIAKGFEEKVERAEMLSDRFNLAQVLLEIALVVTSISLLTHARIYWYIGFVFAAGGIASVVSVLLLK